MGACLETLQDATNLLVAEGFLTVGPRKKGTLVAANPPHLARYRLIFPFGPNDRGQFWHALEAAARQRQTPEQEFLFFYGLEGHRDIEEYRELVREVQTRRVAGLILASSEDELRGTPILEHPGLPRVAIANRRQLKGIPKVHIDLHSFLEQAVDTLRAQGRTRIALLCASGAGMLAKPFRRIMETRGLRCHRHWEQYSSLRNPDAASHLVELLMHKGQPERPDGLVIADDNLIIPATDGLVRAGVRVPQELSVVALTNFPLVLPSSVPIARIGYDIPAILDLLVQRLEEVRQGKKPPEVTNVPAIPEAR